MTHVHFSPVVIFSFPPPIQFSSDDLETETTLLELTKFCQIILKSYISVSQGDSVLFR